MDQFEQEAKAMLDTMFPDRKSNLESQRISHVASILRKYAGVAPANQSLKDAAKALVPKGNKREVLLTLEEINLARTTVADAVAGTNFALQLSSQNRYVAKDGSYSIAAQNRIVELEKLSLLFEKAARP